MNWFEKILYYLSNLKMETPTPWGWFHLLWIGIIIICIFVTILDRKNYNEKRLKRALLIYGVVTLILELTKQIMWSFNYNGGVVTWDYTWYAAPFQLCTTPLFVSLIAVFLKKGKLRDSLLSYLVFYTIVSSFMTILLPESCFVEQTIINIHTMYLHCMSFVLSLYIIFNKEIKFNKTNLFNAFKVFLVFVIIALLMDIIIYNSGILNGETFNMFFISPYFECTLPVLNIIQTMVPYIVFLLIYILLLFSGSVIVYFIIKFFNKIKFNR